MTLVDFISACENQLKSLPGELRPYFLNYIDTTRHTNTPEQKETFLKYLDGLMLMVGGPVADYINNQKKSH